MSTDDFATGSARLRMRSAGPDAPRDPRGHDLAPPAPGAAPADERSDGRG